MAQGPKGGDSTAVTLSVPSLRASKGPTHLPDLLRGHGRWTQLVRGLSLGELAPQAQAHGKRPRLRTTRHRPWDDHPAYRQLVLLDGCCEVTPLPLALPAETGGLNKFADSTAGVRPTASSEVGRNGRSQRMRAAQNCEAGATAEPGAAFANAMLLPPLFCGGATSSRSSSFTRRLGGRGGMRCTEKALP